MLTFLTYAIAFFAGFCLATWLAFQPLDCISKILNHTHRG